MAIFVGFLANKGLIWHVVHKICNYNIIFWKLDIIPVKMIPISTCYTSGRGTVKISWVWPLHYKYCKKHGVATHEQTWSEVTPVYGTFQTSQHVSNWHSASMQSQFLQQQDFLTQAFQLCESKSFSFSYSCLWAGGLSRDSSMSRVTDVWFQTEVAVHKNELNDIKANHNTCGKVYTVLTGE